MHLEGRWRQITVMLQHAALHGGQAESHLACCKTLVSLLSSLGALIGEVEDFGLGASEVAVEQLESAVFKAHDLLLACQSRSRIYMILKGDVVVSNFNEVARSLKKHLSAAPEMYASCKTRAFALFASLRHIKFVVDSKDQDLAISMHAMLKTQKREWEQLRKLAVALGLKARSAIKMEKERLENDMEDARDEGSHEEVVSIGRLLGLMVSIEEAMAASSSQGSRRSFERSEGASLGRGKDSNNSELGSPGSQSLGEGVPSDLLCPLSHSLVLDPVTLSTGATFDSSSVFRWLTEGHRTCPVTGGELEGETMTSNSTMKALVGSCCRQNALPAPRPRPLAPVMPNIIDWQQKREDDEEHSLAQWLPPQRGSPPSPTAQSKPAVVAVPCERDVSTKDPAVLVKLLREGSIEDRRLAAWDLRQLTKYSASNRIKVAKVGAIVPLVQMLACSDSESVDHAITALLNLSINPANKIALMVAGTVEAVTNVMRVGTLAAQEAGAAVLGSLCMVNENKVTVGAMGAIPLLVHLLTHGSTNGKRDAAGALLHLSIYQGNRKKILSAGAVSPLVQLIREPASLPSDRAVQVLANLAMIPEGCAAVAEVEDGMAALLNMMDEGSDRGKQEAAAALLHLCTNSRALLNAFLHLGPIPTLLKLSDSSSPRGQRKATELLRIAREFRHQADV